jgi:hypothetical protein
VLLLNIPFSMLLLSSVDRVEVALLLGRYGMELVLISPDEVIPGSFWGDSEAGLKGDRVYARLDTPVHSLLHEVCHYVCMTPERRAGLDRDAGGDDRMLAGGCASMGLSTVEIGLLGWRAAEECPARTGARELRASASLGGGVTNVIRKS